MKRFALTILSLSVLFVGCSRTHPPINEFLDSASRLKALSGQGVAFQPFAAELATAKARFDILDTSWPADLPKESRAAFKESLRHWDLAHELWQMKIKGLDSLHGADVSNRYLLRYPGLQLVIRDGELSVPLQLNISILLGSASEFFEYGRQILLTRKTNSTPPVIAARAPFVTESPTQPIVLAPQPSPTPTPTPRLAPVGTWFLTRWLSLKKDNALIGKIPGTKLTERSRDGATVHVTDGHDNFDVIAADLTNNIDYAEQLEADAIARQQALDKSREDERRSADEENRKLEEQAETERRNRPPKPTPPPYKNPLDRGPYP